MYFTLKHKHTKKTQVLSEADYRAGNFHNWEVISQSETKPSTEAEAVPVPEKVIEAMAKKSKADKGENE